MANEQNKATFALNLEGDAASVSAETAAELEKLRNTISGAMGRLREMSAAMRALRGSTDDVRGAKDALRAKISAERDAISAANLSLLKQGTTYERLAATQRKNDASKRSALLARDLEKALHHVGGPIDSLVGRFGLLREALSSAGTKSGVAAIAIGSLVGVMAALTAGVVAGAVSLAHWALNAADAARSANLVRLAASGTAANAAALGTQVAALASQLATPIGKLNELAAAQVRALSGTRVSGQGIVDTFAAVAAASEAMGDQVGSQLSSIIDRAKRFGRVQIDPFELQGTGLRFDDIAAQLAKNLKIGLQRARAALASGAVGVNDAAKAMRDAVQARFGEVNAKKLLSLSTIFDKLHEKLALLAANINLEPLLAALGRIVDLFDTSPGKITVTGKALQTLASVFGKEIAGGITGATGSLEQLVKRGVGLALDLGIAYFRVKNALVSVFSTPAGAAVLKTVFDGFVFSLEALGVIAGVAFAAIAAGVATVLFVMGTLAAVVNGAVGVFTDTWKTIQAIDWGALGRAIVTGIAGGIASAVGVLRDEVVELGSRAQQWFKDTLKIGSPSKVFAGYGRDTVAGYAEGVDAHAPRAQQAIQGMAPSAPQQAIQDMAPSVPSGAGGGRGGGGGGGGVNVTVQINVGGGGESTAKQLSDPSFLSQLTHAIEQALLGAGVPTQAATP